jgi:hypothetical protein
LAPAWFDLTVLFVIIPVDIDTMNQSKSGSTCFHPANKTLQQVIQIHREIASLHAHAHTGSAAISVSPDLLSLHRMIGYQTADDHGTSTVFRQE